MLESQAFVAEYINSLSKTCRYDHSYVSDYFGNPVSSDTSNSLSSNKNDSINVNDVSSS